jgi:hypothetical protein
MPENPFPLSKPDLLKAYRIMSREMPDLLL